MKNPQCYPASLKTRYGLNLRLSLVTVLLIMIAVLVSFPKFEKATDPVLLSKSNEPGNIIYIPPTAQPPMAPTRPAAPQIPFYNEDDPEIYDLYDPNFEDWLNRPMTPPPSADLGELELPPTRIYDIWELQTPPKPIGDYSGIQRRVIYPPMAMEVGVEGTVIVKATIDENGNVSECTILKGVPNTGLDEAAVKAIMETKFTPAMQRDRCVPVNITIPIIFAIR